MTSVRDGRPNPMRQLVIVAFVVLALLSVPAFGQEQRGAEDRQSWLVGGGIGYRLGESATPRVSLERWFSRRFALGLGVEQAVLQLRPDVLEGQTFARGISVGLSARALVTAYEAPFRLAFVVIGITGVVAERSVSLGFVRFTDKTPSSLAAGFSIDRNVMSRWSVRLQAEFVRVHAERRETRDFFPGTTAQPQLPVVTNTVSFSLGLNAALELVRWAPVDPPTQRR